MIKSQELTEALSSVPFFNADIVFIKTAIESLIATRRPEPGNTAELDDIAQDAVYLSNRIFTLLADQLNESNPTEQHD